MSYTPRVITDRDAAGDDLFRIEELADGRVKLIPAPDSVTETRTDVNKELMQPWENGLARLDTLETKLNDAFGYVLRCKFHPQWAGNAFTVTGSDFSYSSAVPETGIVNVIVPYGETTYTISYAADETKTLTREITTEKYFGIYPVSFVLADFTWEEIISISQQGLAQSYWMLGDTKDFESAAGEVLTAQIYGFNHDTKTAGGTAGITFGLKNLMAETQKMSNLGINGNGYNCELYQWINQDFLKIGYSFLPEVLKSGICAVDKTARGADLNYNTFSMKVFLFSEFECNGTQFGLIGEGLPYEIFTNNTSRIKKLANGSGESNAWWHRSPDINDTSFMKYTCVNADGSFSSVAANSKLGVNFGFCI